jgi:undecaprenyl-diphosphatase
LGAVPDAYVSLQKRQRRRAAGHFTQLLRDVAKLLFLKGDIEAPSTELLCSYFYFVFFTRSLCMTDASTFEIEQLFSNTKLMAAALASAGILIIASSRIRRQEGPLTTRSAALIGAVQGLCLPFRGFSRSGATISTGLVCGIARSRVEEFSFALAVVLTPAVIVKEAIRLYHAKTAMSPVQAHQMMGLFMPSMLGMVLSFLAGLLALRWLSRWLEGDRWHFFGAYCLVAAAFVLWLDA